MKAIRTLVLVALLASFAAAQEKPSSQPSSMPDMPGMDHSTHSMQMQTPDAASLESSPGSGTAWAPQSSPEYMWMTSWHDWSLMAHGNLVVDFNHQGGPRGAGKLQSSNWLMFMESHKAGTGTLEFREMLSAEPLTTPHPGFPLLFQTGETYHGVPLVDHQHPHDLFMELSAHYTLPLTHNLAWTLYGAPVGEPALGPVAFMHRPSAMEMPDAPISHHVQDSTHITYGVVTTGLVYRKVKVEGSVFNGREPDERRYNFDFGPMDSFSGRVQYAPSRDWTVGYSYGHLRHPELLEDSNVNRQTASVMYNREITDGNWATSLIWGRNRKTTENSIQNSYLLESSLNFKTRNYIYTRLELVDKDELFPLGGAPLGIPNFRIGEYEFGGVRDIVQSTKGLIGLGAQVTFYSKPATLDPYYGKNPVSFELFLRLRPPKMKM